MLYQIGISEALERIKDFSFPQQRNSMIVKEEKNRAKTYFIQGIYDLQDIELLKYFKNRGLDLNLCKKFLMEVRYSLVGSENSYLNVGFRNDSGGYEVNYKVQNKLESIKRCLGKKAITTFLRKRKEVLLFESWSEVISLEDSIMSNQKSLTNHQLGVALASLMESFEKNQKQTLKEQKEILQAIYQLENRINHSIANSKLTVDSTELKKYNDVISKTSADALDQLNKALKRFFLNKYLLIFFGMLFLSSCFMCWVAINYGKS